MTTPIPRRIKDLPAFDIESEDEYVTPLKPKDRRIAQATASLLEASSNKENVSQRNNIKTHSSLLSGINENNCGLFPKRPSEMPLDSESDEDDSKSDHNLNCAILNDSFILSPAQDSVESTPSVRTTAAALKKNDSNLSFVGRFGSMAINSLETPNETSRKAPPLTLQTILEQRKAIEVETPLRTTSKAAVASSTQAKNESEFVTPQVRDLSTMRSTRPTSQVGQKPNGIANEFRSQKVLFQTPMTVSRNAPFPSDSLTFSLCDTISESPITPATEPKVIEPSGKSKKSLERAFSETERMKKVEPLQMVKAEAPVAPITAAAPVQAPIAASSSSSVLTIKKYEYTISKKLGCGGSSSVYLARRKDTGEEYALKVVDLHADPMVVDGYLNETKLLAKLQGNPCVVGLYDYQMLREESKLYLVMEKGDSDLNKILQSYKTNLPLYNLMNILYQMLQAVNYIHQNGVIHSDLKPANFLMVNGRLKLIDFGIASNIAVDSTSIIKFSPAGTFNYISPEALTDISTGCSPMRNNQPKIKISKKSDVWSLGCILYLLLYQKTPFSHIRNINAKMNAISNPKSSIEYPPIPVYYPIMLVHMVKNCLQMDPKKRPSCAELLQYPFNMVIPIQNLALSSNRN